MNIPNYNKNRAFTLIETLVAITILMIAIAGPLTVASKGFTSALDAKNQSVAINLAQEGLEYISFVKDNKEWGNWSPGIEFTEAVDIRYSGCTVLSPCPFNDLPAPYSGFTRTFYFRPQVNIQQVVAVVNVSWNTGTLNGSITLDQVLTSYER